MEVWNSFLDEVENLEEFLPNYISEHDPKILKTEFPDDCKCLGKKSAYPYAYFKSFDDYQKPVYKLEKKVSLVN